MFNQPNTKVMMKTRVWMLAILMLSFFVVSCDKEEEEPIDEAKVLLEYLESSSSPLGKDYVSTDMPAIKTAEAVKTMNTAGTVYIIDIRAADDYASGHIDGAVNVGQKEVLTHLETADLTGKDEISIVCYSGQSAAWVTALLRVSGYDNVYSMKFGMCSWNTDFAGSWNNNIGNTYVSEFTSDPTAKGEAGDLPSLSTGLETGQEILDNRVAAVFAEGFGEAAVSTSVVVGAPESYYVVNYWSEADYTGIGHLTGAMQYTPKASMSITADLKTLPTDKTIAVYCWTGQTSANLAAYLRVIGYDAKSVKFGVNGMIYNELDSHKWSEGAIMDYEYVTE